MDSAHLVLAQQMKVSASSAAGPASASHSSPPRATQKAMLDDGEVDAPLAAVPQPPVIPESSPSLDLLMGDISRCLKGIDVTSAIMGSKFAGLMTSSQAYLESVALATGDHCDLMLQASSFLEFQSDAVCRSGMTMLARMVELNRDMGLAKELLHDLQQASQDMAGIEEVLSDMERERGLPVVGAPHASKHAA